jgi:hypothetical protein
METPGLYRRLADLQQGAGLDGLVGPGGVAADEAGSEKTESCRAAAAGE